jgi:hypothetical protein
LLFNPLQSKQSNSSRTCHNYVSWLHRQVEDLSVISGVRAIHKLRVRAKLQRAVEEVLLGAAAHCDFAVAHHNEPAVALHRRR